MKKHVLYFIITTAFIASLMSSCSIAPDRKISKKELLRSRGVAYYIIEDDINGVLKVLNSKGEVVVNSTRFDQPVYLQIFATPDGIEVQHYDKKEYDFDE